MNHCQKGERVATKLTLSDCRKLQEKIDSRPQTQRLFSPTDLRNIQKPHTHNNLRKRHCTISLRVI